MIENEKQFEKINYIFSNNTTHTSNNYIGNDISSKKIN